MSARSPDFGGFPHDSCFSMELVNSLSRRRFTCALAASAFAVGPVQAKAAPAAPRALRFDNLHTGEKLAVEYFQGQRYDPGALAAINHALRDFRTGDVGEIAPELLDLLHALVTLTGSERAVQVISGYRSPATNAALVERSSGVATGSLHMRGQAIDIRLADVALPALRKAALGMRAGGVGYYPASNFVHVDCGRVRAW
ncbi:Peptidase M15 [Variovorax sp. RA8]|nr:Peptidase M15 [Variovorax sp. RA8]